MVIPADTELAASPTWTTTHSSEAQWIGACLRKAGNGGRRSEEHGEGSELGQDDSAVWLTRLKAKLGPETLVYLRVIALVQSGPDVYLASIGNVLDGGNDLALLRCKANTVRQAAASGSQVDLWDQCRFPWGTEQVLFLRGRRSRPLNNIAHAYQRTGATCVVSVPIHGEASPFGGPSRFSWPLGFLAFGWTHTPPDLQGLMPYLQALAAETAVGFPEAMQALLDDVSAHFLPYLATPRNPGPEAGTHLKPRSSTGDDDDQGPGRPDSPPMAMVRLGSDSNPMLFVAELEHDAPYPGEMFAKGLSSEKLPSLIGAGTASRVSAARVSAEQSPLWLTFRNAQLEQRFVESQAANTYTADLGFAIVSFLICLALWKDAEMYNSYTALFSSIVGGLQLCVVYLFSTWYRKHREVTCIVINMFLTLGASLTWAAYILSTSAPSEAKERGATRQLLAEPARAAIIVFLQRIRFRPAVLVRAPLRFILGFTLACHVLQHVWGYTLLASLTTSGTGFLLTNAATLAVSYIWERRNRKQFLDRLRVARPRNGALAANTQSLRSH